MYDGVDTIVLYDELAYEDILPVHWTPVTGDVDATSVHAYNDRNVRVLQALVALEEHGQLEKAAEDNLPHAADLARMDKKINLLLDLVGQLLIANQKRPAATPIRFNTLGATWKPLQPVKAGEQGVLHIYVRDCIPDPLQLVGRVIGSDDKGRAKVRFVPLGEQIGDLLEKLAFRRHRRQVAGHKQPKR